MKTHTILPFVILISIASCKTPRGTGGGAISGGALSSGSGTSGRGTGNAPAAVIPGGAGTIGAGTAGETTSTSSVVGTTSSVAAMASGRQVDTAGMVKTFIENKAKYKNKSQEILLNDLPDKKTIIDEVIMAIWEHPCSAYASLREKIKPKAEEISKWQITIPVDSSNQIQVDTTEKRIRW